MDLVLWKKSTLVLQNWYNKAMAIQVLTQEQQAFAREAGSILRECLDMLETKVRVGITTAELDTLAEEFIRANGAEPAFKGYHGYTATLCTSVNEECVHGLPGKRALTEGDIVSLDCGVLLGGVFTDACRTFPVGKISSDARNLLNVTSQALDQAVQVIKAGVRSGDISEAIQKFVEKNGFKPVQSLTGHGLGDTLHQPPDIPNIGLAGTGLVIPEGALIAVEPIVSAGSDQISEAADGWTLSITDNALSAHFEHTILVLKDGCEVLA